MSDDVILDSWLGRARGVLGRYPEPGQRYIFRWDDIDIRDMRMLGVSKPLKVTWIADGCVTQTKVLRRMTNRCGSHECHGGSDAAPRRRLR